MPIFAIASLYSSCSTCTISVFPYQALVGKVEWIASGNVLECIGKLIG